MNPLSLVGQVLLWVGFLSGALATVFEIKNAENEWMTINWVWFGISVAIGVAGIVLYRSNKAKVGGSETKVQSDFESLSPALDRLAGETKSMLADLDELAPTEITKRIDDQFADDFRIFADARESMIPKIGMAKYADVMTQFASAERAVNRAWSAGADGYVDEVKTCLERAGELIGNALSLLKAA